MDTTLDDGHLEETHVQDGAIVSGPVLYTVTPTKADAP